MADESAETAALSAAADTGDAAQTGTEGQSAPEATAEETEAKARLHGWRPKEEFSGKGEWIDAAAFVKRGEEILPFVQANNKAMERALGKANRELAELKSTIKDFKEHHDKTEQRAYERAKADLEAQLEQAHAAGDVASVKAVAESMVELAKEATPAKPNGKDAPTEAEAEFNDAFDDWKEANPWFHAKGSDKGDRVMTAAAVELYREFEGEGMSPAKALKKVGERIREEFPHKFENARRREPAAVESGSTARRAASKGYSDMPAEARAACDRFVRQKLLTKEQYVKDFFAETNQARA